MNIPSLVKRIKELAPQLVDVRAELHKGQRSGYAVATKDGRMRVSYWERGPVIMQKSEEQIAQEMARELSA